MGLVCKTAEVIPIEHHQALLPSNVHSPSKEHLAPEGPRRSSIKYWYSSPSAVATIKLTESDGLLGGAGETAAEVPGRGLERTLASPEGKEAVEGGLT
jgi:hypothetical protein